MSPRMTSQPKPREKGRRVTGKKSLLETSRIFLTGDRRILFVRLSTSEALRTIESLAHQILTGDPNGGRYEVFLDGTDFTIAVHSDAALNAAEERKGKP